MTSFYNVNLYQAWRNDEWTSRSYHHEESQPSLWCSGGWWECDILSPALRKAHSPGKLFLKCTICPWFYLLKPDSRELWTTSNPHKRKIAIDVPSTGQFIMAWEFNLTNKWTSGEIIKQSCSLSYVVKLSDVRVVHSHVDHVCDCSLKLPNDEKTGPHFEYFPDQSSTTTSNTADKFPAKPEPERTLH